MKRQRRTVGAVIAIPLGDGNWAFGRALESPLMAFYDLRSTTLLTPEAVVQAPILFRIWVVKSALRKGGWQIVGRIPLEPELLESPWFFKVDPLSGAITKARDRDEVPASREEAAGLERAAVWEAWHVVDRLNDHFAGRPSKLVQRLSLHE